jgi:pilus assembly protein Flp/PilA
MRRNFLKRAKNLVKGFTVAESGATAIEYALIAAAISVAIVVVVFTIGSDLNTLFFANIANLL